MGATVALAGSTGLVGSHILSTLSDDSAVSSIHAFSRKPLPLQHTKIHAISLSDSSTWPKSFPADAQLFISGLGTTRANAGGFDNQRKVDFDLNLELAKAAKDAGSQSYVLISSNAADSSSRFGYTKMKGELEDAVRALDFDHTIILRPGLIVGKRNELRMGELMFQKVAGFMGSVGGNKGKDFWAQDADVIAKAAVRAGLDCVEGNMNEKVKILNQSDIVRMGRTEWKS